MRKYKTTQQQCSFKASTVLDYNIRHITETDTKRDGNQSKDDRSAPTWQVKQRTIIRRVSGSEVCRQRQTGKGEKETSR